MELKIDVKIRVSLSHFEEIVVGALEGGSNYWYSLNINEFSNKLTGEENEPISTRIAKSLFENSEFEMNVYDIDSNEKPLGAVSQASILNAIKIANEKYNDVYTDLMEGTGDADTADVLFQLAVMKDIMFS